MINIKNVTEKYWESKYGKREPYSLDMRSESSYNKIYNKAAFYAQFTNLYDTEDKILNAMNSKI